MKGVTPPIFCWLVLCSMYTTFIYPFSLKLPFRWGKLLIFCQCVFIGTCMYFEGVWLYTWKQLEELWKKFWVMRTLVIMSVPAWPDFWSGFHCYEWNWTFCMCEVDIHVKLLETSSEWISLGKIMIAQSNDLKLRYWGNIASMQTGVIY